MWPDKQKERYQKARSLIEEWPDLGLRVALVLEDPTKYPAAWARAVEIAPQVRGITLALPSEDNIEISPKGLIAIVVFRVGNQTIEHAIKVAWSHVVDLRARTQAELRADRGAVAKRKATAPAVKLLESVANDTDLLSPEELGETE